MIAWILIFFNNVLWSHDCSFTALFSPSMAALYSPVRAVPLRPRLHSPNGHRLSSPRPISTFQPIAASRAGKPLAGPKTCPLSQTVLGSSQSQRGSLPVNTPPDFEHLPSAARQLQIIALSSGRQSQSGQNPRPLQALSHIAESPEPPCQKKKTSGGEDGLHLPPELPKSACAIPSPPSLLCPASPLNQTGPQTKTAVLKCEVQEQQEKVPGTSASIGGQGSTERDKKVEKDHGGEQGNEEASAQKEEAHGESVTERKDEEVSEEEHMKVTEEGESIAERSRVQRGEDEEAAMDQADSPTRQAPQKSQIPVSVPMPEAATDSGRDPKPILGQAASGPGLGPEVPLHPQRPGPQLDQPVSQEDCENMSTQSDNHSGNLTHYCFVIFLVNRVRPQT